MNLFLYLYRNFSLLNRFVDKKYNATEATIQLDLRYAVEKVNGVEYKVELWDTVGAERFRSITANYFRNAQGAILVYDITDPKSLNKLEFWLNDLYDKCDNPNIAFIVVGNKIDQERAISRKEGEDFANKHGGLFIETSAKCDQFVEDTFHNIVKKVSRQFLALSIIILAHRFVPLTDCYFEIFCHRSRLQNRDQPE